MSLERKLKKTALTAALALGLLSPKANAQAFTRDDAKSATYTVLLQTAFSVTGALINKKPIKEALMWGGISGTLNYSAKYMIQRSDHLFWPARFVMQTGTNLNMNYIEGYKPFERGYYSFAFVTAGWDKENNNTVFKTRIVPAPLLSTALALASDPEKFDAKATFRTGVITFQSKEKAYLRPFKDIAPSGSILTNTFDAGQTNNGRYFAGTMTLKPEAINTATENHEVLHDMQLEECRTFASIFDIVVDKHAKGKQKFQKYLEKRAIYQLPYVDISRTIGSPIYMLHYLKEDRFIEFEAAIYHGKR